MALLLGTQSVVWFSPEPMISKISSGTAERFLDGDLPLK
jgi:hypothetical protein